MEFGNRSRVTKAVEFGNRSRVTKAVGFGNFMGGVCDETCVGWGQNIRSLFYSVSAGRVSAYIVSCYICIKHIVYCTLCYRLTTGPTYGVNLY